MQVFNMRVVNKQVANKQVLNKEATLQERVYRTMMLYDLRSLNGFLILTILAGCFVALTGCQSNVKPLTEDLSLEGYFQKGIEALDKNKYELALQYYQAAQQKFPDNIKGNLWATYEIGFIYYKMNKYEQALEQFNGLIERYKKDEQNAYPTAPLILAEKLVNKIEEKTNKVKKVE
jgi:outer membrane protein assembly factor BamD (BamD/ComL family)